MCLCLAYCGDDVCWFVVQTVGQLLVEGDEVRDVDVAVVLSG